MVLVKRGWWGAGDVHHGARLRSTISWRKEKKTTGELDLNTARSKPTKHTRNIKGNERWHEEGGID